MILARLERRSEGVEPVARLAAIRLLLVGCLVATPLGVSALANVPITPMKLALAVFVVVSAILLTRGVALKSMPGTAGTLGTGIATGLLNGGFGMGGPPLVIFYRGTPAGVAAGRASIIALVIATDLMGLGFQAREGLITSDTFSLSAWLLPPCSWRYGSAVERFGARTQLGFGSGHSDSSCCSPFSWPGKCSCPFHAVAQHDRGQFRQAVPNKPFHLLPSSLLAVARSGTGEGQS